MSRYFAVVFIIMFLITFLILLLFPYSAIDIQLHDTYFVIASVHILGLFAFLLGTYAVLYYLMPKLLRSKLNKLIGWIHFTVTVVSGEFMIVCICGSNLVGVRRKYYRFDDFDTSMQFRYLNEIIITAGGRIYRCSVNFSDHSFFQSDASDM